MKILIITLLFLFAFQFAIGQDSVMTDTTLGRLDIIIEKTIPYPYYLLAAKKDTYFELEKSEVIILDPNWISKVDIWTEDVKKKEYGYEGNKTLVVVTLEKKHVKAYLKLIGKKKDCCLLG